MTAPAPQQQRSLPSDAAPPGAAEDPSSYEQAHVHAVYQSIAPHFSATRHRPWPRVASFLAARPPGSVGLDVGCGNGKYLGVNGDVFLIGSDRSSGLVGLASAQRVGNRGRRGEGSSSRSGGEAGADVSAPGRGCADAMLADGLDLPFLPSARTRVDFAISIAVLHHMSTRERRVGGIRALLECVRPPRRARARARSRDSSGGAAVVVKDEGGQVLVFVWALEQGSSRRGWEEGGEQDLLVPWVMKTGGGQQQQQQQRKAAKGKNDTSKEGGGQSTEGGTAAAEEERGKQQQDGQGGDQTFRRYYHLYRKGELEEDVVAAGGEVLSSGYERDNWWAIARSAAWLEEDGDQVDDGKEEAA
ncbi:uncharacterized protein E0L32_008054 [Thyridium curvatum]|uniref:Uncharacterized protein n=1 Tax=Thyridium curvatum TaxID=1093900 RepID=A0A507AU48_9PEZI|nr:uncharacterized protein E0L32_008054 [Thyridium curvatum]TPX11017.1 hypothetical protein E0L32_008054 [Thyridium curvatum]